MALEQRDRPAVLVVESDEARRRLLAVGLDLDGADVLAARSWSEAHTLAGEIDVKGVVVGGDGDPDPEGMAQLLQRTSPDTTVVVLAVDNDGGIPEAQLREVSQRLGLASQNRSDVAASAMLAAEVDEVAEEWRSLCQWDPMLPPEADPPVPGALVAAFAAALGRPQPIGWGPDPQVEAAVESFTDRVGSVDVVVAELVCLREALRRWTTARVPVGELSETVARLEMIADRAIQVAVSHAVDALQRDAHTDPLTGLMNRRALEREMRRELARASRYDRRVAVMVIDVDGLKKVNDTLGHAAGDEHLCRLAGAFREGLRLGDTAYRIGGDEFVVILPEVGETRVETVAARLAELGAPEFSWGAASFPDDGSGLQELLDAADRRLYDSRRVARSSRRP